MTNPPLNTYYWRAVRRIAKRRGISISKARKMDWQKESNAEKKRRSKAHQAVQKTRLRKRVLPRKESKPAPKKRDRRITKRITTKPPKRTIPSRVGDTELTIRDYDRIPTRYEYEDLEGSEDEETDWQDWQETYPELDELDGLEEFLEEFEERNDEKYQEPS